METPEPSPQALRIAYFATLLAAGDVAANAMIFDEKPQFRSTAINAYVRAASEIHNAAVQAIDGESHD